ncbi:MAG: MBL fold metallo-hydrolase [Treponema sp.]|nr:MBL fold metallo-hydrolase [Treponema sp.]
MLSVRFWGVRGSIPCPGPDTVIYGGNTSCIEIRADDRLLVVDLGSGARPLGDWLMANEFPKNKKIKVDFFISHTHWDHIMGFPMFAPIYNPGAELRITGAVSEETESLKKIFETQLSPNYWPIRVDELSAKIEYKEIRETTLDLGSGLTVTTKLLNHPTLCLGYRFNYKGKSAAFVFDHEPFKDEKENEKIIQFLKGADVLIHDAQYTNEEYPNRIGWGHSSIDHAIETASKAGVKKLVLFHHEPTHSDGQLVQYESQCAKSATLEIVMAKEGMAFQV